MRLSNAAAVLTMAGAHVAAQNSATPPPAPVVKNNPRGAVYKAVLQPNPFLTPTTPEGGPVRGEVIASSTEDGVGVKFEISYDNLPSEGGPFDYHLHVAPVPADGNCNSTLAHLDPFGVGQVDPCDRANPETCEVGDLSGKVGPATADDDGEYETTFTDDYVALFQGPGAFFGNRSFVLHYENGTRLACANFQLVSAGEMPSGGSNATTLMPTASATGQPTGSAPSTSATVVPVSAAATASVSFTFLSLMVAGLYFAF